MIAILFGISWISVIVLFFFGLNIVVKRVDKHAMLNILNILQFQQSISDAWIMRIIERNDIESIKIAFSEAVSERQKLMRDMEEKIRERK